MLSPNHLNQRGAHDVDATETFQTNRVLAGVEVGHATRIVGWPRTLINDDAADSVSAASLPLITTLVDLGESGFVDYWWAYREVRFRQHVLFLNEIFLETYLWGSLLRPKWGELLSRVKC